MRCNDGHIKTLNDYKYKDIKVKFAVSLSGGVDSVCCLHYLKE